MFRDRLKGVAKKGLVKLFNMEFDTEERDPAARGRPDPSKFDPAKIPKIVQGDGDTPGPNHKQDIGRTWMSAQMVGGVPGMMLDIRPPDELAGGWLPGAVLLPGEAIRDHMDLLPTDKTLRVTIYDQTGGQGSTELAQWLRDQGWGWARRLQGGFAEWLEHGEPTETPTSIEGAAHKVSDPVTLSDGRKGWVLAIAAGPTYTLWLEEGGLEGPVGPDGIQG